MRTGIRHRNIARLRRSTLRRRCDPTGSNSPPPCMRHRSNAAHWGSRFRRTPARPDNNASSGIHRRTSGRRGSRSLHTPFRRDSRFDRRRRCHCCKYRLFPPRMTHDSISVRTSRNGIARMDRTPQGTPRPAHTPYRNTARRPRTLPHICRSPDRFRASRRRRGSTIRPVCTRVRTPRMRRYPNPGFCIADRTRRNTFHRPRRRDDRSRNSEPYRAACRRRRSTIQPVHGNSSCRSSGRRRTARSRGNS
jgi:hypothetical protein